MFGKHFQYTVFTVCFTSFCSKVAGCTQLPTKYKHFLLFLYVGQQFPV